MLERLLTDIDDRYRHSVRRSIVDYILKNGIEQARLNAGHNAGDRCNATGW